MIENDRQPSQKSIIGSKRQCSFKLDEPTDLSKQAASEDRLESGLLVVGSSTAGDGGGDDEAVSASGEPTPNTLLLASTSARGSTSFGGGGGDGGGAGAHKSSAVAAAVMSKKHLPPSRVAATKKSMSIVSTTSNASSLPSQFGIDDDTSASHKCFNKMLIKCNYFVFGPDDNPMFVWLIILNVCVLYNIWLVIARQSFEKLQTEYENFWRFADMIADTVYFFDVVVQFRTGYLEQGR